MTIAYQHDFVHIAAYIEAPSLHRVCHMNSSYLADFVSPKLFVTGGPNHVMTALSHALFIYELNLS